MIVHMIETVHRALLLHCIQFTVVSPTVNRFLRGGGKSKLSIEKLYSPGAINCQQHSGCQLSGLLYDSK